MTEFCLFSRTIIYILSRVNIFLVRHFLFHSGSVLPQWKGRIEEIMIFLDYAIPIVCLAGFLAHTASNWMQDFGSGRTEVETTYPNLTSIPFPVIFQFSVTPAFNVSRLEELGYGQPIFYFNGETLNYSYVGWNEQNKGRVQ